MSNKMKFPGSIGVMIIVISFLSVSFISAIEMTPTYKEEINYNFVSNDVFNTESNKSPEYKDYIIPKNDKNKTSQNIVLYQKGGPLKSKKIWINNSEITPLKTILDSLNYSKNCESITVDFNLKTEIWNNEYWKAYPIKYPITPILCTEIANNELLPIGFIDESLRVNEKTDPYIYDYNGNFSDIIFTYKVGNTSIYLKNYDDNKQYTGHGGTFLPIDTLKIAHHHDNLKYLNTGLDTIKNSLKINESDYKIKWCENTNNTFSNPFIDINDKFPNVQYCKINLKNFTTYGDKIIINADSFNIINNNQVSLGDINKLFTINDIDIIYQDQKCLLKFNDINVSKDLGPICNHKILLEGDWAFESQYYEGHVNKDITGHAFNMSPFAIFQMNSTNLVGFIGIVIIFSGLYALSIGLSFLDWAVILSVIAFILITV